MSAAPKSRSPKRSPSQRNRGPLRTLLTLLFAAALLWSAYVYLQIASVARQDEAAPADAIAVFGAAEYAGRPSPVFHARLDHAIALYRRGIAPVVITLGGGSDRDLGLTEGGVGRDYLLARGIPLTDILAETRSTDTEEQVHRLAAIARDHGMHRVVVVSDGTHLFRIRELCRAAGLTVYTSPRPALGRISNLDLFSRYAHEILSYTSLKLGLEGSALEQWIEGRPDS